MEEEGVPASEIFDAKRLLKLANLQNEIAKNFNKKKSKHPNKIKSNTGFDGLYQLDITGLYTQISPTMLGRKAVEAEASEKFEDLTSANTKKWINDTVLEKEGNAFRDKCTTFMEGDDFTSVTYLVLGKKGEGRANYYQNAEAYNYDPKSKGGFNAGVWEEKKNASSENIKAFKINPKNAHWDNKNTVYVYSANIPISTSSDIELLHKIYDSSLAKEAPLCVHAVEGLDESGLTFAMMLLHNYGDTFKSLNSDYVGNLIYEQHEKAQNARGEDFCPDKDNRFDIASTMATALKSVQVSELLMEHIHKDNPELHSQLEKIPTYLGRLFLLEESDRVPRSENKLKYALEARAISEGRYFQMTNTHTIQPKIIELKNKIKGNPGLPENLLDQWSSIKKMLIDGSSLENKELVDAIDSLDKKVDEALIVIKEKPLEMEEVPEKPVQLSRENFFSRMFEKKPYTSKSLKNKMQKYSTWGKKSHYHNEISAAILSIQEGTAPQDAIAALLIPFASKADHQPHNKSRITKLLIDFYEHNTEDFKAAVKDKNNVVELEDGESKTLMDALVDKKMPNATSLIKIFEDLNAEMAQDLIRK